MNPSRYYAPFRLSPIAVKRVWGGRRLVDSVHPDLDLSEFEPDTPIGETWEMSDVGEDPRLHSRVVGGWADGKTLRELLVADPKAILGPRFAAASPRLPLLYKYIDAREPLSVQVHPSDEIVAARGIDGAGKTEAWLILDAAPGATIIYGFEEGVTYSDYLAFARSGEGERGLAHQAVRAGDLVYLPAGTIHAIGAGILLAEIQQSSDTTYRIYDWDRLGLDGEPRQLHLEEASWIDPPDPLPPCPYLAPVAPGIADDGAFRCRLRTEPFELWEYAGGPLEALTLPPRGEQFGILSVLEGTVEWQTNAEPASGVYRAGTSAFLPAACGDGWLEVSDHAHLLWMTPGR